MKKAFIMPVDYLEYDNTNYHMALTHLVLKYPKYAEFYKQKRLEGEYVILDNSLIELDGSMTIEDVLKAADIINPDEIVLPDVFLDRKGTMAEVQRAIGYLKNIDPVHKPYNLQAVCHGKNVREWQRCFHYLDELPEIDCIGIPKVTHTIFPNGRIDAVKYAMENRVNDTEIHLLGMWENADEFRYYTNKEKNFVRGVDSSIVPHCTIENQSFANGEFFKPNWKINLESQYDLDVNLLKENQSKFMEFV